MASKSAKSCVAREIKKHCRKRGRNKCRSAKKRRQVIAMAFSICRREGFHSIPKR